MAIATWFNRQSRLVQILLMLIPVVNWITEILVRWSAFLKTRSLITLVMAILVTFFGLAFGWIDLIWILLFKHLIFARA
ncbi:MAG TPA: hypothetical protein H9693_02690 [Firmicutes bacterium]|nr:hypothetical protein [Bacillota bacterium]